MPPNTTHVLRTTESQELDIWSSWVGFDLRYLQLGRGKFEGEFRMNVGSDFCVVDQHTNLEFVVEGAQMGEIVALFFSRGAAQMGVFDGVDTPANGVGIQSPGQTARLHAPAGHQMTTVLMPLKRVHKLLTASGADPAVKGLSHPSMRTLSPDQFARVSGVVGDIVRANSDKHVIDRELWLKEIEQGLLPALLENQNIGKLPKQEFRRANHARIVQRALEQIDERFAEPLGVESLAIDLCVSPRTLYYSFRDILDMTPVDYILARRLRAARDLLRHSDPAASTVTSIAVQSGFGHLSHFAAKYHRRFGEYPSETLKKRGG